jgi:hypothetical protein
LLSISVYWWLYFALLIFGGIVDHHCLEVVVIRFVDIDGIVDHHCLEKTVMVNNSTKY